MLIVEHWHYLDFTENSFQDSIGRILRLARSSTDQELVDEVEWFESLTFLLKLTESYSQTLHHVIQADGAVSSIELSLRWWYQSTGQIDLFRDYQLRLWYARREQLRILQTFLTCRIDYSTRNRVNRAQQNVQYYLEADQPSVHPLAQLPPPYSACQICVDSSSSTAEVC